MPDPIDPYDAVPRILSPWRDGAQARMTPEGIIGNGARSAFERITRAPLSDGQVGAGVFGVPVRLAKIAEVTYPGRSDEEMRAQRQLADLIDAHVQGTYLAQEAALWEEARARRVVEGVGWHYGSVRGMAIAEAVTPLYAETVAELNGRVSLARLARMGWPVVVRAIERDHDAVEALARLRGMNLDPFGYQNVVDAARVAEMDGWITSDERLAITDMARARMTA